MSNTILLTVGLVHVLFKFNHNNEAESISTILRQSGQGSGERRGNYACIMPKNILHNIGIRVFTAKSSASNKVQCIHMYNSCQ